MNRAAIAVAATLLASCGKTQPEATQSTPAAAPVTVTITPAASRDLPNVYEAIGTVRARTSSTISSRTMGYVREVRARVGDQVTAGQVLVTLDSPDLDSQIRQAEAAQAEARSVQPEIESAVAAAKAQLDLAQSTFARMQDLFNKKSISNQEFDEASGRLKVADANHNLAQAKRAQLTARIAQAEQAVRSAQINQSFTTIVAPFAGTVTEKIVEPGILATPGAPLMTIEQSGALRLEASVEESRLSTVRVGQSVEVSIDALEGTLTGRVSEIVPTVDPVSRTFIAKIEIPQRPQLRAGQFGRARFPLGSRAALTIPAAAITTRGQLQMVFTIDSGIARSRMITTGAPSANEVEVLSGLSPGESVVTPVPPSLTDGARVEVRP
ncbi:MAG: efflux RND transporter periplasmic adaptor subunit [Bryobacteraceae bacterium]